MNESDNQSEWDAALIELEQTDDQVSVMYEKSIKNHTSAMAFIAESKKLKIL